MQIVYTAPDVNIRYVDEGSGPAVMLMHGHTLDHRIFDDIAPSLIAAGFRVLRPDLRGHGRSSLPPTGYHPSRHAADMLAVLDHADVATSSVVGFSIGGAVAIELAVAAAERVERLALISAVIPDRRFEPEFMENLKAVAKTVRAEGVAAAMAGPWMASPLFAHSLAKPGIRAKLEPILADFPGAEYLATERDRPDREWSAGDRLAEISAPTLVVSGDHDMPGFRAFSDELATTIPNARSVRLEDTGHLVPLEAPEALSRLLLAHLA